MIARRQFPAEALPLAAAEVAPRLAPDSAPFPVTLDCVPSGEALPGALAAFEAAALVVAAAGAAVLAACSFVD